MLIDSWDWKEVKRLMLSVLVIVSAISWQ
ncbi:MAG: hypothetical protein RLZZ152_1541, partial [Pseudomonadota bacterium]